jgi:hypothetical protein
MLGPGGGEMVCAAAAAANAIMSPIAENEINEVSEAVNFFIVTFPRAFGWIRSNAFYPK